MWAGLCGQGAECPMATRRCPCPPGLTCLQRHWCPPSTIAPWVPAGPLSGPRGSSGDSPRAQPLDPLARSCPRVPLGVTWGSEAACVSHRTPRHHSLPRGCDPSHPGQRQATRSPKRPRQGHSHGICTVLLTESQSTPQPPRVTRVESALAPASGRHSTRWNWD